MANEQVDNITYRKPQRSSSLYDLSTNQSLFDTTMLSVPNTSFNESQNSKELYEKNNQLQEELLSANDEITKLNIENTTLKRELDKCKQVIAIYKKVGTAENIIRTPKSGKKKSSSRTSYSCNTPQLLPTNNKLYHALENFDNSISHQTEKQEVPNPKVNYNSQKLQPQCVTTLRKICILSNNNKNDILSIAENTFQNNYNLCHYLKPHVSTEHMLSGLETKLRNYSMNDFCIILLGDEDFKRTNNYYNIIFHIREVLQAIQHTNIIICLPTYKCPFDTSLFNCRVETFNNLLYLDILTHGHAFLLDSNLNLEYDYSMFNKYSGSMNNRGLATIFKDLLDLITDISQNVDMHHKDINKKEGTMINDNFFLD